MRDFFYDSFLVFIGVFFLFLPLPAHAQFDGSEDPLTRDISVSYYKTEQANGDSILVDRWAWLNYADYYRFMSLAPTASVVPPTQIDEKHIPDQKLIVTETSPTGNMLRYLVLSEGMATITNFSYTHVYRDDVLEFAKTLREKILAEQTNKTSGPASTSALLTFTLKTKTGAAIWRTNDPQDIETVRTVLKKSPELPPVDQIRNRNRFNSPDRVQLVIDPTVKGLPQQIDFDQFQIRSTDILPSTRTYVDKHRLWEAAMEQKALIKKYKTLGIENPPKSY